MPLSILNHVFIKFTVLWPLIGLGCSGGSPLSGDQQRRPSRRTRASDRVAPGDGGLSCSQQTLACSHSGGSGCRRCTSDGCCRRLPDGGCSTTNSPQVDLADRLSKCQRRSSDAGMLRCRSDLCKEHNSAFTTWQKQTTENLITFCWVESLLSSFKCTAREIWLFYIHFSLLHRLTNMHRQQKIGPQTVFQSARKCANGRFYLRKIDPKRPKFSVW